MKEWKPIESAPRDGTRIDLYNTIYGRITNAYWEEAIPKWNLKAAWKTTEKGTLDNQSCIVCWMPIPDDPVV